MGIKYDANTSAIRDKLYPLIKEAFDKQNIRNEYKKVVNDFIANRTEFLYDSLPCDRITCFDAEMDKLFDAIKIPKATVKDVIRATYYSDIENFSPLAAKHEFTIAMLCIIKYFLSKNMKKEYELAVIHLSFSGKFYPSLHFRSYPYPPARHVMEFVVNNKLSKKFDLVTEGSVFGAIRSISTTWMTTYTDKFQSFEDEDIKYLIDQLYSRIGSFMKNIAEEYYKVYEDKDSYIAYSSDSFDEKDFHLADSDMLKVSRFTEKTVNSINTNGIDYRVCKMCSNNDITPNECKAVIESIISNKENVYEMKELISLLISLYFASGEYDVTDIKFITFTVAPKPNAKQKEIVRSKEIIEKWLSESGTAYLKRRSRTATKNSYERAVRMYFALAIHNANR